MARFHRNTFEPTSAFIQGLTAEFERYSAAVNGVLAIHEAETLDSLKIIFFKARSSDGLGPVEEWLQFAASKRARVLELDMLIDCPDLYSGIDPYSGMEPLPCRITLREDVWRSITRLCLINSNTDHFFLPLQMPSLQKLSLHFVYFEEGVFQGFLKGCPMLFDLVLKNCDLSDSIRILAPCPVRILTIIDCDFHDYIEIDTPLLQAFHYLGPTEGIRFEMKDVTGLVDAYFSNACRMAYFSQDWSFLIDLVHVTMLTLCDYILKTPIYHPSDFEGHLPLVFSNLRSLSIMLEHTYCCSLEWFRKMMDFGSFPILESLFIKDLREHDFEHQCEACDEVPFAPVSDLRLLRIDGFAMGHLELVEWFLTSAIGLDTVALFIADAHLSPYSKDELEELRKKLDALPKASPSVKILLCKANNDSPDEENLDELYDSPYGVPLPPHAKENLDELNEFFDGEL